MMTTKIVLLIEAIEGEQSVAWDHLEMASTVQRSVDAHTERGGTMYVFEDSDLRTLKS